MYITNDSRSGYRGGDQVCTRGLFLMFVQPPGTAGASSPIKCVVRKVALQQLGHFMMGRANIRGKWFTVSGSYGSDGLPMDVPQEVYDSLTVTLPADLYQAWNKGGGHNSCGSEAPAVRKWAKEHLAELRK